MIYCCTLILYNFRNLHQHTIPNFITDIYILSVDTEQAQCDQKKSPKVNKSCPKNDFTRKMIDLTSLQKLPKNVGDLGKLIVAKGFKKLPKVNKSPNLVTLNRLFTNKCQS